MNVANIWFVPRNDKLDYAEEVVACFLQFLLWRQEMICQLLSWEVSPDIHRKKPGLSRQLLIGWTFLREETGNKLKINRFVPDREDWIVLKVLVATIGDLLVAPSMLLTFLFLLPLLLLLLSYSCSCHSICQSERSETRWSTPRWLYCRLNQSFVSLLPISIIFWYFFVADW